MNIPSETIAAWKAKRQSDIQAQQKAVLEQQQQEHTERLLAFGEFLTEQLGLSEADFKYPKELTIEIEGHTFEYAVRSYEYQYHATKGVQAVKQCPDCGEKIIGQTILETRNDIAWWLAAPSFQTHNYCEAKSQPAPVPEPTTEERFLFSVRSLIEEALQPVYEQIGYAQEQAERVAEKASQRAKDLEYQMREQANNFEYEVSSVRRTAEEAKKGGSRW